MAGGIVFGTVAVSADSLTYFSAAIKASFFKCFKIFKKFIIVHFIEVFLFLVKNLWHVESQKELSGFSQNLQ